MVTDGIEQYIQRGRGRPPGRTPKRNKLLTPDISVEEYEGRIVVASQPIDVRLGAVFAERGVYDNIPLFQRGEVWRIHDKQYLIDSILRGLSVPPLLVNRTGRGGRFRYEVIDGQQRLNTILDFRDGKFRTITEAGLREYDPTPVQVIEPGRFYYQLSLPVQAAFESYSLRMIVLNNESEETLRAYYRRLQNQKPLAPGEMLFSYDGLGAKMAHVLKDHPAWKVIYAGEGRRHEIFEICCAIIAMECFGLPVTLRIPALQVVASRGNNRRIEQDGLMQTRITRRLEGIAHVFRGVHAAVKTDLVLLYMAAILLEEDGVDLLSSEESCGNAWYGSVHNRDTHVWKPNREIAQLNHRAMQIKFWEVAGVRRELLAIAGLHRSSNLRPIPAPYPSRFVSDQEGSDVFSGVEA